MDDEIRQLQSERASGRVAAKAKGATFDEEIFEDPGQYEVEEVAMDEEDDGAGRHPASRRINPTRETLSDTVGKDEDLSAEYRAQNGSGLVNTRISDRESQVSRGFSLSSLERTSLAFSHHISPFLNDSTTLGDLIVSFHLQEEMPLAQTHLRGATRTSSSPKTYRKRRRSCATILQLRPPRRTFRRVTRWIEANRTNRVVGTVLAVAQLKIRACQRTLGGEKRRN
jgi:hypothetical protein